MRMFNINVLNIPLVHCTLIISLIFSTINLQKWASFLYSEKKSEGNRESPFLATQWASDSLDCRIYQTQDNISDFVPVIQCQWTHPGIATYAPPMFADVDGDGATEIVVLLEHSPDGFAVINPQTCEAKHIIAVNESIELKDGGVVLGDVDANGIADIFIPAGSRIQRWQYNPTTLQFEKIWETAPNIATADRTHLDILDLNQDGIPELIPNVGQMVNSVTGEVYPGILPILHTEGKGLFAFSADALPGPSPGGQSVVELIYGTHIYRYDFNVFAWVEVRSLPNYSWGSDACVAIADMDLDGDLDAVITHYLEAGPGEALIWDLQTDQILGGNAAWDYPSWKGSRMMIANMDGDPYPEMAMTSRFTIFAVDDIVTTGGFGNIIWLDITTDESGHTELTSFDFDGNGKYEIAYRDETHLRIFNGMGTGIPTGEYPSGADVLLNSNQLFNLCRSFTGMEYPTIGDVDNDDEAEIVTTCRDLLNIFKSGSLPWRDATQVWNTNSFNVTCVNQDGTIPAIPVENYTLYNNFLSQVVLGSGVDSVAIAVPDAYLRIVDADNQCGQSLTITMEICNQGEAHMPAGTPIAIYHNDPRLTVATLLHTLSLEADLGVGHCIVKTVQTQGQNNLNLHLFAVVNDSGYSALPYVLDAVANGGSFPVTGIIECDYTNNLSDSLFQFSYGTESSIQGVICENDTFFVDQIPFTEAGTYEIILPAMDGCDSLITLVLDVLDRGISMESAEICQGETYPFFDQNYSLSGTYFHSIPLLDGCDSLVQLDLTVLADVLVITSKNICEGATYDFNGNTYSESGYYVDTLHAAAANGCDSMIALNLNVLEPIETILEITLCTGLGYPFFDTVRTETGIYTQHLISAQGCDSLVILNLTILEDIEIEVHDSICEGRAYWFGNHSYTESGVYPQHLTNALGCDSLVNLVLTVMPKYHEVMNDTICRGDYVLFAGYQYAEQGSFQKYYVAENGCDSIVTLNLHVLNPAYEEDFVTLCEGESVPYGDVMLTEAGVYHDTFAMISGCDSFVWMHVYVIPSFETTLTTTICEGEYFPWNDSLYTQTGIYQAVYAAENGCDSTIILDLTVEPNVTTEITENICAGGIYDFNDVTYSTTGFYTDTLQTAAGCDSIIHLQLFVLPHQFTNLDSTICEGDRIEIGHSSYDESGFYTETLSAHNGCDSLVELNLIVLQHSTVGLTDTICEGGSYEFGSNVLIETGFYSRMESAANGCDSIINLDLVVLPIQFNELSVHLCQGDSIVVGDQIYHETGFYENTLRGSNGCDSIVILDLTVYPTYEMTVIENICEGIPFEFGNLTLTESGFYTHNFSSVYGCDSTVNLILFFIPNQVTESQVTICAGDSIGIGDFIYLESGDYWHTLQSRAGCDSLVHIELSVVPAFYIEFSDTICSGDSIFFNQQWLTATNRYQANLTSIDGCDSTVVMDLTVLSHVTTNLERAICHGDSYLFDGEALTIQNTYHATYTAQNGCDSIVTLDLRVFPHPEVLLTIEICQGESYPMGEQVYTESGIYIDTLETERLSCDSIVILDLTVLPNYTSTITQQICEGGYVMIGNNIYQHSGTFWTTLVASTGCDSVILLNLTVLPSVMVEKNETICAGDTIEVGNQFFTNTGTYIIPFRTEYDCDSTVMLILNVQANAFHQETAEICDGSLFGNYSESGIYYDTIPNGASNGCDSIIELTLNVLPNASYEYLEVLCADQMYDFFGDTLTVDGTYQHRLLSTNGCDSLITLHLKILPEIAEHYEYKICDGDSIFIAGTYRFQGGTFHEALMSIDGCDSLVETVLWIEPWIEIDGFGGEICVGDSVMIGVAGANNYHWTPVEGLSCTTCPNPIASPEVTTVYTITSRGCLDNMLETQVEVVVHPAPTLNLNENITIPIGQSVHLQAIVEDENDIIEIYWTAEDKRFCAGCFDINVTPLYTVTYTVYITDIYGCINQQQVTVNVREECIDDDFKIPNMMTPNGDGFNDEFYVLSEIPIDLRWLRIYNRWGQLVFETSNINDRWDGTYRRTPLNPGVYAYYMELICPNGEPYKKVGNVTIVK